MGRFRVGFDHHATDGCSRYRWIRSNDCDSRPHAPCNHDPQSATPGGDRRTPGSRHQEPGRVASPGGDRAPQPSRATPDVAPSVLASASWSPGIPQEYAGAIYRCNLVELMELDHFKYLEHLRDYCSKNGLSR